ncbi:MAG TPA: ABC transporter permease [Acidobacteriaceae bacterium]|jgi:predicted permease|nr:ABC transporter permease [Acidobacteriaceae bacterium]
MLSDLRQALRQLRKSPGFTLTVVITLALGIGATTAIFTLVEQVMLKSLPVTKPEQLWRMGDAVRCCNWGGYTQGDDNDFSLFSWEAYRVFRANTPAFEELAAMQAGNAPLGVRPAGTNQQAETRNGEYVSGNFFSTFGVSAWIGRTLTDADDVEGAPPVAVMSFHTWQERYGSDRSVVGASYQINGHPFTIVGVAPPGFYGAKLSGSNMPDLWLPVTTEPLLDGATSRLKTPSTNWLDLIGRVRPGTDPKALEAQLQGEFHGWLSTHVADMQPQEKQTWQKQTLHLTPGGAGVADMRDSYGQGLLLLLGAAGCVLLVACANIANLLLARGLRNRQQTSIRVALGASRGQLVRRALLESVMLGIFGGMLGVGLAYGGARLILHLAFQIGGPQNYVPVSASPSWTVMLFTFGVSVLTGIVFGIAPAWMTSHAEPVEALRGANRSVGGRRTWAQKALVITQAAMSLVLLSAAAMLAQSLRNLEHQQFGFETQGRYMVWINPLLSNYKPEQLNTLFRQIEERMRGIPGVHMVSSALYAPMTGDSWNDSVRIEGRPEPGLRDNSSSGWTRVTPGFFATVGMKVMMGRPITEEDTPISRHVAVVNQAFVKRFFPKENPIGKHFGPDMIKYAGEYEIVGVVADARYMTYNLKDPPDPMFYLPEAQTVAYDETNLKAGEIWSHYLYNIVLWAPGYVPGLQAQAKKALADVDPALVMYAVDPYAEVVASDFAQQNMIANLTLLFGAVGLVLAAVGLYGVTAYAVEQRTSEIGVRMALGADRTRVVQLVLKSAFLQVLIGLALGIPAAIGAGYLISTQLYGVKPWDALMLGAATLMLGVAALAAAIIPARRAAGLDPVVALRMQ